MDKSVAAGAAGTTLTGAVLTTATASLTGPAANLGGYIVAQQVAGAIGAATGTSLGGAALSVGIATIGGPIVAGTLACAAVGTLAYGAGKLLSNFFE